MARDIGGYFDKMAKQGRGGRRLGTSTTPTTSTTATTSTTPGPPTAPPSRGGLKDILRDALSKGKSTARKTGARVKQTTGGPSATAPAPAHPLPEGGVVSIEYTPSIDGDPDPGEVVWNWIPFEEDPTQGKDRPVVIIGRRGDAMVGVPLTTKQNDREAQIPMGTGDWDPQHRQSFARIWRMLDLDPTGMRREGAVLDRKRFDQLVAAVDRYYDVSYPTTPASPSGSNRAGNNPNDDY
ncbi:MAG: type II toxin-antitoxin system PemK/MazF family toxin [Ilumatobacteraceae bacterium]